MVGWVFDMLKFEFVCVVCQFVNMFFFIVMECLGMCYIGLGCWYDMDCKCYDIMVD